MGEIKIGDSVMYGDSSCEVMLPHLDGWILKVKRGWRAINGSSMHKGLNSLYGEKMEFYWVSEKNLKLHSKIKDYD